MERKGIAAIGALIGILVFIMLLFVGILPVLATNINGVSNVMSVLPNGGASNSLLITMPLFIVLGAVAMIAFGLLTG